MKSFLAGLFLLGFLTAAAQAQQDADEKYMSIYGAIQQGDTLSASGQAQQALENYQQAQMDLAVLHGTYPDWNPRIVIFRQKYLAGRIDELKAQLPAATPANPPGGTAAPGEVPAVPAAVATTAPADWSDQLAALRSQLQNAQSDNATLAAKLKEALAVQPATLDPQALAAAREQIRDLMKQNDLLQASLEQQKQDFTSNTHYQQLKKVNKALAAANDQLAAQQKRVDKLAAESAENLQKYLVSDKALAALRDEDALLQQQLAGATNSVAELTADLAAARTESAGLRAEIGNEHGSGEQFKKQLKAAVKSDRPVEKLKAELAAAQTEAESLRADLQARTEAVDTLQKQAKAAARAGRPLEKLQAELAAARAEAKAAEADKEALQERISQLQSAPVSGMANPADTDARVQDLTRERDELLAQLGEANRKLNSRQPAKEESAQEIARLNSDLASARDQLNTLTQSPVPYTAAELALFVTPLPASQPVPISTMPSGAADLVASAQKHFAAQEFDQAGADYQKILQLDTNNLTALANLAAIEINGGHFDSAEAHLRSALAGSPNDAYSLSLLGSLQLQEQKYSDALATLSQSVRLDPANPETYNYLGVTLSHLGLRLQAETALRKAIQLDPGFGPGHLNLAEVYLDQQPPAPLLARWHYQKALDAGQAHSPGIEKQLSDLGAPVSP